MVSSWTVVVFVLCLCSLSSLSTGAYIQGKVGYSVDGVNIVSLKPGSVTELLLSSSSGEQIRTFADRDGRFTLHDVAPGTYVLTTQNPGFIYPEVSVSKVTLLLCSLHAACSVHQASCCGRQYSAVQ